MKPDNQPKQVLYGELCEGQRSVGCQWKRAKDNLNCTFKNYNIQPETIDEIAEDQETNYAACHSELEQFRDNYETEAQYHRVESGILLHYPMCIHSIYATEAYEL